jgi:hypothetical protein
MDKRLILCVAAAALGGTIVGHMLDQPVVAQQFGQAGNSSGVAAATPNAAGASHAWMVDMRTNMVVMCRGDSAGRVDCSQTLMPGAAKLPR